MSDTIKITIEENDLKESFFIKDADYGVTNIINYDDSYHYPRRTVKSLFRLQGEIEIKPVGDVEYYKSNIKNVIFNEPATIVFWEDGTKTIVKAQDDEPFDKEKGLAMAIVKKRFGNNSNYYNVFKKWCE